MFTRKSLLRTLWMSWTASFVLHGLVSALIVAVAVILPFFQVVQPSSPSRVLAISSGWAKLRPAEERLEVTLTKHDNLPRVGQPEPPHPQNVKPEDASAVAANNVTEMVKEAVDDSNAKSAEENLEKLDQLAGTLNQVSNADSLNKLANSLNKAFGNKPRATAPAAEPVAGEFDFDTAQIHDVRREEASDGSFKYTAILLDAEGRTLDSELDEATGKQVYDVMVLIKKSPLLEKLYRQTLMSLFDQMMKPGANAAVGTNKKTSPAENPPPAEHEPPSKPNSPQPGVPFDPFAE